MTTTVTASGLQYQDITVGDGTTAKAGDHVSVHYTGWLRNDDGSKGSKFDSSKDRNEAFSFPLGAGHVIKGWDEGVQQLKKGSRGTFYIPSYMAYGERGMGAAIPPNSILIFDVEVVDIQ